jgi:multidrug efflux pump subunit AcrA (membrane-fusion protein)
VVHKAQSPLRPTPVKLGRRARDAVEVIEGLAPGDRVLLRAGPGEGAKGDNAMRLGAS